MAQDAAEPLDPPAQSAAASVGRPRPVVPTGAARRRVVGRSPESAWQRRRPVSGYGWGAGRAWAWAPLVGASGRRR
jgi:hypothetical protein